MPWEDGFIAVDWGTTHRRGWRLDAAGRCTDEFDDARGVLAVRGAFVDAVAEIRARLGDRPLVMAGMVGSNRGWVDAPYVACPAGLADLAQNVVWPEPRRAAIVPGVSFRSSDRADVMRGEEVQILGAVAAGVVPRTSVVCHPGTHAKWISVEDARIVSFRTVMTGEIFDLLRRHSILADLLAAPASPNDAFRAGARRGLTSDAVAADLFSVRARVLLGDAPREDAASYTSGLLVGADVRVGLSAVARETEVVVMGRPELTALYATALVEAQRAAREVDGRAAFLEGVRRVGEALA